MQQFPAVPAGAETFGPVIIHDDGSVLVGFPDHVGDGPPTGAATPGGFAGPRPSVVQATRL